MRCSAVVIMLLLMTTKGGREDVVRKGRALMLAGTIAVGVVYNNARVALSVRSRDLATLRVLGFTRREVSTILLLEQAIQVEGRYIEGLLQLALGEGLGVGLVVVARE